MYLTDSDTIKICWYWPDTDTDTRINAALIKILNVHTICAICVCLCVCMCVCVRVCVWVCARVPYLCMSVGTCDCKIIIIYPQLSKLVKVTAPSNQVYTVYIKDYDTQCTKCTQDLLSTSIPSLHHMEKSINRCKYPVTICILQ